MTEYRRFQHPGGTWYLAERRGNRLLTERVNALRAAFIDVKHEHPFKINEVVILPDHLHCIWTLPEGDSDFSTRWGLIKAHPGTQHPLYAYGRQFLGAFGGRGAGKEASL